MTRAALTATIAGLALCLSACGGGATRTTNLVLTKNGAAAHSRHAGHGRHGRAAAGRAGHSARAAAATGAAASGAPAQGLSGVKRIAFIRRADRICQATHAGVGKIGTQIGALVTALAKRRLKPAAYYARSSALTHRSAGVVARAVTALRALAGSRVDPQLGAYLAGAARQAQLLHREGDALANADSQRVQALNSQLAQTAARVHAAARGYGFHTCGGT